MGLFDKKEEKPKADFSDVQSGSSSTAPERREPGAGAEREARTYTVRSGDTLSEIAEREYGDASKSRAIYEANRDRINNPDLIYPGQILTLPPSA